MAELVCPSVGSPGPVQRAVGWSRELREELLHRPKGDLLEPTVAWTHRGLDPPWPGPTEAWTPVAWNPVAWTPSGLDPQWPGPTVIWTPSGLDPGACPDGCGVRDSSLGSALISSFKTMDLGSQAADIVWLSELWLSLISAQACFRPLSNQISGSSPVSSSTSPLFTCWTPHTFLCSCV